MAQVKLTRKEANEVRNQESVAMYPGLWPWIYYLYTITLTTEVKTI
jgi:hypothetical protein